MEPMAVKKVVHPSVDDRRAHGLEARDRAPLSSHTGWAPAADRPDPVGLLEEQDATREPDLVLGNFGHHWVYVVGPLVGAAVAVGFAFILRGHGEDGGAAAAQGGLGRLVDGLNPAPPGRAPCS
jgi:hypothetical protein